MSKIHYNTLSPEAQAQFARVKEGFSQTFVSSENAESALCYFLSPGRTEIGGNHTDHQMGKVIVASVQLATFACVEKRDDMEVHFLSEGYPQVQMSLDSLEKRDDEDNTSQGLVRGVAKGMVNLGRQIGGFNAYIASAVPSGSGLSSSASFELLLVSIFDTLFNDGQLPALERARVGQLAENVYFNKPSGLLDQSGSSFGDLLYMDFGAGENPETRSLHLDLDSMGYDLWIVLTGGSHANLTPEYAAVPQEMGQVASYLGVEHLSKAKEKDFYEKLPDIRSKVGDRAVLRAMHLFSENKRVEAMVQAIEAGQIDSFLDLVDRSGLSSELLLQNVRVDGDHKNQELSLALALSRHFLEDKTGACRVHGGGFAGTIQAYIRKEDSLAYKELMESVFGPNSCQKLLITPNGAGQILM